MVILFPTTLFFTVDPQGGSVILKLEGFGSFLFPGKEIDPGNPRRVADCLEFLADPPLIDAMSEFGMIIENLALLHVINHA